MNREEYNNRRDKLMSEGHSVYTADAILTGDPMFSALALAGSGELKDMLTFVEVNRMYRNAEAVNKLDEANTEVYSDDEYSSKNGLGL